MYRGFQACTELACSGKHLYPQEVVSVSSPPPPPFEGTLGCWAGGEEGVVGLLIPQL